MNINALLLETRRGMGMMRRKKKGGGDIGTKGPEAKTHHLTLLVHTQNEEVESSFSEFDDWDGNGSDSIFGLCEPQPLCPSFPS